MERRADTSWWVMNGAPWSLQLFIYGPTWRPFCICNFSLLPTHTWPSQANIGFTDGILEVE